MNTRYNEKYRAFKILAIVQLVFSIIILTAIGYTIVKNFQTIEKMNPYFLVVTILTNIIILLFAVFNIYLVQKKYPDQTLTPISNLLYNILLFLYCISNIVFSYVFVKGLIGIVDGINRGRQDFLNRMIFCGIFIFLFCIIYNLFTSLKMKNVMN